MRFTTYISPAWFLSTSPSTVFHSFPTSTQNYNLSVSLYPHWYSEISMEWEIPKEWVGAAFNIYLKPGGSESYVKLNSTPTTNPFYSDSTTREYSKASEAFYVIEAILPSGLTVRSMPITWEYKRRGRIDKIANEIQRREYMLLSKFVGVKSFFFRKKNYGIRCPRCWNPTLEKVMDDHCEVCYGTSWEGGFWDPIPIFIQWDTTKVDKQKGYSGIIEPLALGGWTISYPTITSEDVIIRSGSWGAYRVISCNPTELQTKAVRQIMTLTHLEKFDVENKLVSRIPQSDASSYLTEYETQFLAKRFPQALVDNNLNNDPKWAQKQSLTNLPMYKV